MGKAKSKKAKAPAMPDEIYTFAEADYFLCDTTLEDLLGGEESGQDRTVGVYRLVETITVRKTVQILTKNK